MGLKETALDDAIALTHQPHFDVGGVHYNDREGYYHLSIGLAWHIDVLPEGYTSLDLSSNAALEDLNCAENQLTNLDISKNIALKYLNCSRNQLSIVDVYDNILLEMLDCGFNQIINLDVSSNSNLKELGQVC